MHYTIKTLCQRNEIYTNKAEYFNNIFKYSTLSRF